MTDTIAAISTAQGAGGIGVIRISGDQAKQIADRVFVSPSGKSLQNTPGYTARYGHVQDQEGPIDEVVALVFDGPKSYTGEDVVELSCHGGLYLTKRVLRAVLSAGARAAGPGEFTRRAFLNGKLGLTEAEAVMDLIAAQGRQAARAALAGREGALHQRLERVKDSLVSAAAHLSAWADYPEEDIPQVERSQLEATLSGADGEMKDLLARYDAGRAIREGVDTVIAGRPNVGKSTLMNLLSGCERSIVTDVPGTTRDVVEETVLVGDIALRLADTAGIRSTDDPVERIGVELARRRVDRAGLVLAVFDASDPLNQDDLRLLDRLQGIPAVAVINKTDLPRRIEEEKVLQKVDQVVYMSAHSGEGLAQLEQALAQVLGTAELDPAAGMLSTERQRDAAARCLGCIRESLAALRGGMTLDAVTVTIEDAVQNLLELTGERVNEAVVDQVFHRFCVGK
ncbi:MAG: tRNA uridine-5-carboxymethylaminomethyl(34) synthesis GTPase MnmE [Clostridiales bacterium]|nr:tRNA uridine-5-carboxymethylaminomethyl(34) synthesis GTPase MnmE [Clostridiales bacterium]